MKKLYKSTDKKIDGVCAGIAEYFSIDATLVRLVYALLTVFSLGFPGVILYAIAAFVMPRKPFPEYEYNEYDQNNPNGDNK